MIIFYGNSSKNRLSNKEPNEVFRHPNESEQNDRQEKVCHKRIFTHDSKRTKGQNAGLRLGFRLFVGINDTAENAAQNEESHMREQRLEVLHQFQRVPVVDEKRKDLVFDIRRAAYKVRKIVRQTHGADNETDHRPTPCRQLDQIEEVPHKDANSQNVDDVKYKIAGNKVGHKHVYQRKNAHIHAAKNDHFYRPLDTAVRERTADAGQKRENEQPERLNTYAETAVKIDAKNVFREPDHGRRFEIEKTELKAEIDDVIKRNEQHERAAEQIELPHSGTRTGIIMKEIVEKVEKRARFMRTTNDFRRLLRL